MSNKFLTVIYDMSRPGMQQKASLLLLEADWTASGWSHAFADRDEARKELYRLQESIAAAPQVVADERELPVATWFAIDHADGVQFHPSEEQALRYSESGQCVKYFSEDQMRAALQAAPVQAQEPVAEVSAMPGTSGFTVAVFKADDMPIGSKVYRAPVQPVAVPDGAMPELPPLPKADVEGGYYDSESGFSKKAMQEYATAYGQACHALGRGAAVREYVENGTFAAPAAQGDAKDTERLRWLAETGARISWSMDGEYCAVWLPDERDGTESRPAEGYPLKCYDSWHRAIDAAIAAKAAS